jgi:hypothetical protein
MIYIDDFYSVHPPSHHHHHHHHHLLHSSLSPMQRVLTPLPPASVATTIRHQ